MQYYEGGYNATPTKRNIIREVIFEKRVNQTISSEKKIFRNFAKMNFDMQISKHIVLWPTRCKLARQKKNEYNFCPYFFHLSLPFPIFPDLL